MAVDVVVGDRDATAVVVQVDLELLALLARQEAHAKGDAGLLRLVAELAVLGAGRGRAAPVGEPHRADHHEDELAHQDSFAHEPARPVLWLAVTHLLPPKRTP